jgi:glycosyltransferase involved in cell wall biosynthesis
MGYFCGRITNVETIRSNVSRVFQNSSRREAVLFIAPNRELPFVEQDVAILKSEYDVDVLCRQDYPSRRSLLPAVLQRLASRRFSLLYIWFAEPHDTPALNRLAKVFRLKTIIVSGGYDVAAVPSIGYGSLVTRGGQRRVRRALLAADAVLPFSKFAAAEVQRAAPVDTICLLYPGVDCDYFRASGKTKEAIVVTVGRLAPDVWRRKGLDVFASCSRLVPGARFVIIGRCEDEAVARELARRGGNNLELVQRRVTNDELRHWYQRASVYAQLSAHEGFGLALAEAMACQCVPVASNTGSLPEVVGQTGFLVDHGDTGGSAAAIRLALDATGTEARNRIVQSYPLQRRAQLLKELITAILRGAPLPNSPSRCLAGAIESLRP